MMADKTAGSQRKQRLSTDYIQDLSHDRVKSPHDLSDLKSKNSSQAREQAPRLAHQKRRSTERNSPAFDRELPHTVRGHRLSNQSGPSNPSGQDKTADVTQQALGPDPKIMVINQATTAQSRPAGPSIWLSNAQLDSRLATSQAKDETNLGVAAHSINNSDQFQLKYEHMPKVESEIGSDLMTFDMGNKIKGALNRPSVDEVLIDERSDATLGTIKGSLRVEAQNSTVLNTQPADEPSIMTNLVVVSDRVVEQRFDGSDQKPRINFQHLQSMEQTIEKIEDDQDNVARAQASFARTNHHQSQSLEILPNLKELANLNDTNASFGNQGTAPMVDVSKMNSVESDRFLIDQGDQKQPQKAQETPGINLNEKSQLQSRDVSMSEFAFTERPGQEGAIQQAQTNVDRSITARTPGVDSNFNPDDQADYSVTDTRCAHMESHRFRKEYGKPGMMTQCYAETSVMPSETDQAMSVQNSINARRSECVLLDSFGAESPSNTDRQTFAQSKAQKGSFYEEAAIASDYVDEADRSKQPSRAMTDNYDEDQFSPEEDTMGGTVRIEAKAHTPEAQEDANVVGDGDDYSEVQDEEDFEVAATTEKVAEPDPADLQQIDNKEIITIEESSRPGMPTQQTPTMDGVDFESEENVFESQKRITSEQAAVEAKESDQPLVQKVDLFESAEGEIRSQNQLEASEQDPSRAYYNQEFNSEQNFTLGKDEKNKPRDLSQEDSRESKSAGADMNIVEDQTWVDVQESAPGFDGNVFTKSQSKHSREIKSMDINQNQPKQADDATSNQSGIEKYESDENEQLERTNQYSSVQMTSQTVDGPDESGRFAQTPSRQNQEGQAPDSMAFNTLTKRDEGALMYEESYQNEVISGADELSPEVNPIRIAEEAQNAAISVMDESEQPLEERESTGLAVRISPTQQAQDHSPVHQLSSRRGGSQSSNRTEHTPASVQKDRLVPRTIGLSSFGTNKRRESAKDPQNDKRGSLSKPISIKRRKVRGGSNKKSSLSPFRKDSKSPPKSKSPKQTILYSVGRGDKSKSPPVDKRLMIKNGRVIISNTRHSLVERHQFPIRKSNYDPRTVEKMLMNKQSFLDSERMMIKMKERIQNYNQNIIPFAQKYYMAMQNQQPLPLSQPSELGGGSADDSHEQDQMSYQVVTETKRRISPQDRSKSRSSGAQNKTPDKVANLPEFLKTVSKPGIADQSWDDQGINNIQLRSGAEFDDCQANESVYRQQDDYLAIVAPYGEPAAEQVTAYTLEIKEHDQKRLPSTAAAVPKRQRHPKMLTGGDNDSQDDVMIDRRQESIIASQNRSVEDKTSPYAKSEFRFRSKKQNRRIITTIKNAKEKESSARDAVVTDSSAYFNSHNRNRDKAAQTSKSTKTSFYPQENLSVLLHAANRQATAQQAPATSQKLKLAQRRISKNQTIGKIYAESNTKVPRNAMGPLSSKNASMPEQSPKDVVSMQAQLVFNLRKSTAGTATQDAISNDPSENYDRRRRGMQKSTQVHGQCRTTGNNSHTNLIKGVDQRKISTLVPSEQWQPVGLDSQRFYQQRMSQRDYINNSVMQKFQRWVDKGYPISNTAQPPESLRRTIREQMKATASARMAAAATIQTPNKLAQSASGARFDNSVVVMESFEIPSDPVHSMNFDQSPQIAATRRDFGKTVANKINYHGKYQKNVEQQQKRRLFAVQMKHKGRDEFTTIQQPSNAKNNNLMFNSLDAASLADGYQLRIKHGNSRMRSRGQMMIKTNTSSSERNQNQIEHAHRLSVESNCMTIQQQQMMRHSLQPRRTIKQPHTENQRYQNMAKLSNLSQIYKAVPNLKKRQNLLRDNYVRQRLLDQPTTGTNKSSSRYARKSNSPHQSRSGSNQKESARKGYFNDKSSVKTRDARKNRQSKQKLEQMQPKVTSQQVKRESPPSESKHTSKLSEREATPLIAQQRQQRRVTSEDSQDHVPISLDLVYQPDQSVVQSSDAYVKIDQDSMQILQPSSIPGDEIDSSGQTARQSTERQSRHQLDDLQEQEIRDEEQTNDVPVVVAEDEIGVQDQSAAQPDPILGEQSIDEDEAGEVAQKQAAVLEQQANLESYRLDSDSQPPTTHRDMEQDALNIIANPAEEQPISSPVAPLAHDQDEEDEGDDDDVDDYEEDGDHDDMQDEDGYEDEFEDVEANSGAAALARQHLQDLTPLAGAGLTIEVDEDEEEEEDDDYYADDKFVYEDVAEDPSSEDPEQKFLKQHAHNAKIKQNQIADHLNDSEDEGLAAQDDDEDEDGQVTSAHMRSLERAFKEQRKTSHSYSEHPLAPGIDPYGDDDDYVEGDDIYGAKGQKGAQKPRVDEGEEDYDKDDFEDNEDDYSDN